jgi:hypothetical protein
MSEGYDFSFARPGGAAIRNAGRTFVARYVSNNSKGITRAEIDDYTHNNLAIALVYEEDGRELLGGFAAGQRVARNAIAICNRLGLGNVAIHFAVDFDVRGTELAACVSAIDGAVSILGQDLVGGYGGINFINAIAGHCKYGWQTYAWSRGQVSSNASLYQYLNGQSLNGSSVDFCRNLKSDFGSFNITNLPSSTPASAGGSLLGVNKSGHSNAELQTELNRFGYNLVVDGLLGPNTTGAIENFQSKQGLTVDGIVGPITWSKLTMSTYSITDYQTLLNKFGFNLVVDGVKGPLTTNAISQFQATHSLTIDGIVGPITWAALNVAPPVVAPPVVVPPVVVPPVVAPPVVVPPIVIVTPPKEIILTRPNQTNISLGTIVTSNTARKIIYGVYAVAAIAAGGAVAYYFGIGQALPTVVTGVQAVIAYLAIPVGGLALANTPSKNQGTP